MLKDSEGRRKKADIPPYYPGTLEGSEERREEGDEKVETDM